MIPWRTTNFYTLRFEEDEVFSEHLRRSSARRKENVRSSCMLLTEFLKVATDKLARWARTRHLARSRRARFCLYFSACHAAFRSLRSSQILSASFFAESAKTIRTKLSWLRQRSAPHPVLCPIIRNRGQTRFRRARSGVYTFAFLEKVSQRTYMEDCSKVVLIGRAGTESRLPAAGALCASLSPLVYTARVTPVNLRCAQNRMIA